MMQTSLCLPGFGAGTAELPVKAARGGGGVLERPTFLIPPFLPTSAGPLAQLQSLLQLLSSHLQDPNNLNHCSQDGDPRVYCIFLRLNGGKKGGEPTFFVFLYTGLLLWRIIKLQKFWQLLF